VKKFLQDWKDEASMKKLSEVEGHPKRRLGFTGEKSAGEAS
jgi:hypothetical protein